MYFPLNFCENFKNSFAAKYLRATDSKLIPLLKNKTKQIGRTMGEPLRVFWHRWNHVLLKIQGLKHNSFTDQLYLLYLCSRYHETWIVLYSFSGVSYHDYLSKLNIFIKRFLF